MAVGGRFRSDLNVSVKMQSGDDAIQTYTLPECFN
jgi:hypothetical protein